MAYKNRRQGSKGREMRDWTLPNTAAAATLIIAQRTAVRNRTPRRLHGDEVARCVPPPTGVGARCRVAPRCATQSAACLVPEAPCRATVEQCRARQHFSGPRDSDGVAPKPRDSDDERAHAEDLARRGRGGNRQVHEGDKYMKATSNMKKT